MTIVFRFDYIEELQNIKKEGENKQIDRVYIHTSPPPSLPISILLSLFTLNSQFLSILQSSHFTKLPPLTPPLLSLLLSFFPLKCSPPNVYFYPSNKIINILKDYNPLLEAARKRIQTYRVIRTMDLQKMS